MATSVKIRERDKRRLDRLQGELTKRRGRKVPQQDLIAWLLSLGENRKEGFADDAVAPMTAREVAALRRLSVRTGVKSREEEIDAVVAGL
jgi:predicted transcriptional regulator